MDYEDKSLKCTKCEAEFTFSAGEQQFYAEKELTSEPKRCKPCRQSRRRRNTKQNRGGGDYRSPAFENSAPAHQKIRGRRNGPSHGGGGDYRSPGLNENQPHTDEYRSPAFRDSQQLKPEDEYRSPAYRESANINPAEEYRSPGFQDSARGDVRDEYRSPGYPGQARRRFSGEKPMFEITCSKCEEVAMVPFLPDEREDPVMCQDCYKAFRKEQAEAAAIEKAPEPEENS
jgi:CxxC-x17-CxxC domain-containing protein